MLKLCIAYLIKFMKLFTKIVQGLIALYTLTGAAYMMGNYEDLATVQALTSLPSYFWIGLGSIQILFALILISALFFKRAQAHAFNSAIGLAGLSLLGSVLYIAYVGTGILWAIAPAVIYGFIAHQSKHNSTK